MSLANEYKHQFRWRDWPTVLADLPPLKGKTVLDLGCGIGDLAEELVARGARVIGFDANEEFIQVAQVRGIPNTEFRVGDLRDGLDIGIQADGIWCSFTAAFFYDFSGALGRWAKHLKQNGWIAVTEIDDLFGHEPLAAETKAMLDAYAENATTSGRYDFYMGRKLDAHLLEAGFLVSKTFTLEDKELSFNGQAQPDVLTAWRSRFARMELLRRFCGDKAHQVEEEFISCLQRHDHRSLAKVHCCIANKSYLE